MPVTKTRGDKATIKLFREERRAVDIVVSLLVSLANQNQARKGFAAEMVGFQQRITDDGTLELLPGEPPEGMRFVEDGED